MKIKSFLETLDKNNGNLLFEGGKEGQNIDAKVKTALKTAGISYLWAFQPDGYDMVILEHNKDGEKAGSWSAAFFTEAEVGRKPGEEGETGEELFGESISEFDDYSMLSEAEVGYKILDHTKGNFLDIVNLAIEIAENPKYKKGFTSQNLRIVKSKKK